VIHRETPAQHLAQANRHITEAEDRIDRKIVLLDYLRRIGADTEQAERLLAAMQQNLGLAHRHREMILAGMERGGP
jgi:hypothetical protein